MKNNQNFGKSLFLLVTPLVTSLNLGIVSGKAATFAASEMAGNIHENIEGHHELVIAANSISIDISDRQKLLFNNLLKNTGNEREKSRSTFANDLESIMGDLSLGVNVVFESYIENESTPLTPVKNLRSEPGNNYQINSLQSRDEDLLKIFLKSFQFLEESDSLYDRHPIASYTERVKPAEIHATPASEYPVLKAPSQDDSAKAPINSYRKSSEPLTAETQKKVAQLPKAVSIDHREVKELFEPLQIIGSAVGLGFLLWMLIQD